MKKNLFCIVCFVLFCLSISAFSETADLKYLTGRFNPAVDTRFEAVPASFVPSGGRMYLRKETLNAFLSMAAAAKKTGVKLTVVSATRNFDSQKSIWEGKWKGSIAVNGKNLAQTFPNPSERAAEILKFSSMPGTSRHHWGTDMDLNSVSPAFFNKPDGKKIYKWLSENASKYGFAQPYTAIGNGRTGGYSEEKWHWSYLPLSKGFLADYTSLIQNADISGFLGSETAVSLNITENYVKNVNEACR